MRVELYHIAGPKDVLTKVIAVLIFVVRNVPPVIHIALMQFLVCSGLLVSRVTDSEPATHRGGGTRGHPSMYTEPNYPGWASLGGP